MKILSWNVNGLRAIHKKNGLMPLLNTSPDILCLQETKLSEDQIPKDLLDIGYHPYFSFAEKKGYSGVCFFSKNKPANIKKGFGIKKFDSEGRFIQADFKDFTLMNIYFPNGKASLERLQYKMDFYEAFLKYSLDLKNIGKRLVICGDVNTAHKEIDLARPKENEAISGFLPREREWIDRFMGMGFIDTFRLFHSEGSHYTWWDYKTKARDRNIGWRIDYFFISENLKKRTRSSFILSNVYGSDHCPIGIELTL